MSSEPRKVGIISCSGEAIPEGTISRLATRRVLELLRPHATVTICLPLFLAGNEGERNFAKTHPTITIDGCEKRCAQYGTEEHSGAVSSALVVSEILGTGANGCQRSSRNSAQPDNEAVWAVAERIAAEVDAVLATAEPLDGAGDEENAGQCACSRPMPGLNLLIGGSEVSIPGLALIFGLCTERGIPADVAGAADLLNTVKIYHHIPAEREREYRDAYSAQLN